VSFSYTRRPIFTELSLNISSGRTALVGENGAGKTTLIRLLTGVLQPSAGSISHGAGGEASMSYMPQVIPALRGLTVEEQVAYCAWLQGVSSSESRRRARLWVKRVGLGDAARQKMRTLSGGQLRRVGLASALATSPQVAILDEPTAGLDPTQQMRFRDMIKSLESEVGSWLIATHDVNEIVDDFDQVLVLASGRVWSGSPSDYLGSVPEGPMRAHRAFIEVTRGM